MLVRVKSTIKSFGFDGVSRRRPGKEFEFMGGECPSWAEVVTAEAEAKPKGKPGPKPKIKTPDSAAGNTE